jgi:uncharacterized SAM-binding protein YcdF (DUF218 family)
MQFSRQAHGSYGETRERMGGGREFDRKTFQEYGLRRVRKLAIGLLAATGLLVATVVFTPVTPWWARKLAGPMDDPTGEILIVLGGSALEDGIIGESSYWRSVYAVRAYRQSPFARVIVSGGGQFHPAASMRDFLVASGIPADRIMVENRSVSTRENAVYTKQLIASDNRRLVLLTSDYHMFRALRAFRKVGLNVTPRPFPDASKRSASVSERWPVFFELCEEEVKTGYYWVRGWI